MLPSFKSVMTMNQENPVLQSTRALKGFLRWCKKQGIVQVKVGDVEVIFDPYSGTAPTPQPITDTSSNPEELDEALLYHSSE